MVKFAVHDLFGCVVEHAPSVNTDEHEWKKCERENHERPAVVGHPHSFETLENVRNIESSK